MSAISDELGYHLAGLTDGEGSFAITRGRSPNGSRQTYYGCAFIINMRRDDRPLLERLRGATGLGRLYNIDRQGGDRKPQCRWQVETKGECLRLAEIFETYPLWSKKRRDFEIWAQAVRYWNSPRIDGLEPMARWFVEIRRVRGFDAGDLETEVELSAALF